MQTLARIGPILLLALPAAAQNPAIDLNLWTAEHLNGSGPWIVDPARQWAESTNTVNTDCSVFYSDFDVTLLDFRMTIDPLGGDDDLPGFVLGWQPGDSSNATADYLVVDWKRITQAYQNWGTANIGLAISRMTGPFTRGVGGAPIDLWSHTLNCTELARGATHGAVGWSFATDYHFRVLYTQNSVDIWLNGAHEFSLQGTFTPGRFGCYNYSQSRTGFQFSLPGAFTLYGAGCAGSAGTPYLFGPVTPVVGGYVPIITANLAPATVAFTAIGLSDSSLGATPLPLALGSFGAPGCTLYTSAELLLPATNWNGTAYVALQLPPTLPPTLLPVFFAQTLVFDPAANQLGFVFSNAGAMTIGIR